MKHGIMGPRLGYTVDDQFFADILATGVGADSIEVWCEIVSYTSGENPAHNKATVMVQEQHPDEPPTPYLIDLEVVMNGVQRMMQNPPANPDATALLGASYAQMWEWLRQSLQENDTVMIDAETADVIIQYGLFEELRYS